MTPVQAQEKCNLDTNCMGVRGGHESIDWWMIKKGNEKPPGGQCYRKKIEKTLKTLKK
jgi:hypothetical protein